MQLGQLRARREQMLTSQEQQAAEAQERYNASIERAQDVGVRWEKKYDDLMDRFRLLFEAIYVDTEIADPVTITPMILLDKTTEGKITAVVETLSNQENYTVSNWGGHKTYHETPPSYHDAENFRVTYTVVANGESDSRVEDFAAKRTAQDYFGGPPHYSLKHHDDTYSVEGVRFFVMRVQDMLPDANKTLDMLVKAASNKSMNPQFGRKVRDFYAEQRKQGLLV